MKVIGFNFEKISGEQLFPIKPGYSINTNIEFITIDKQKVDLLLKEAEAIKVGFKFSIVYAESESKKDSKFAEILFVGSLLLSTDKEESKELLKNWKKKELAPNIKIPLFNVILKKATPKAIFLEDELSLPPHIPFPRIQQQAKKE